ncbi:MAG TPA: RDD family protein [Aliiroseovarius sp.]|nr:RDD family protein [Aliiroseovarius sp.]
MLSNHAQPAQWGLPDPDSQSEFYQDVATKRAIAWVIDMILISLLVGLVVLFTVGIGLFFLGFLMLVVSFLYRFLSLASGSATPGMRLVAIELRTHHGARLDRASAFLHTVGYLASVSFVLPQIISIWLMATSGRGQGLSDMVLGTAALNRGARR